MAHHKVPRIAWPILCILILAAGATPYAKTADIISIAVRLSMLVVFSVLVVGKWWNYQHRSEWTNIRRDAGGSLIERWYRWTTGQHQSTEQSPPSQIVEVIGFRMFWTNMRLMGGNWRHLFMRAKGLEGPYHTYVSDLPQVKQRTDALTGADALLLISFYEREKGRREKNNMRFAVSAVRTVRQRCRAVSAFELRILRSSFSSRCWLTRADCA